MSKTLFSLFSLATFVLFSGKSSSYGTEWTGESSSSWTDSANWIDGEVPESSQTLVVLVPGSNPNDPILDIPVTLQGIEAVAPGGTLAGLTISGEMITFAHSEPFIRNLSQPRRFVTLTNSIFLPGDDLKITTSSIKLHGLISGAGGLHIKSENFSSFDIVASSDNTYQGLTRIEGRASVSVTGASIGIPGDVLLADYARLVLGEEIIADESNITLMGLARLDISRANSIHQIVDSPDSKIVVTQNAQQFTLLTDDPTELIGRTYVGGYMHKASNAPLILSGSVFGYGTIEANSHFSGIFEPQWRYLPILTWKGSLTIHDQSQFIVTPSIVLDRAFMRIEGPLSIEENATVIIEVRDDGTFGSGEFALWEWNEQTQTSPNLEQFVLNGVPDDFSARLEIVDHSLVLVVDGPRLNLGTRLVNNDEGALIMKVTNAVEGVRYSLEMSHTLNEESWLEVDKFDGWDFLYEFSNGIDLSQYLIYSESGPSIFFRLRVDL